MENVAQKASQETFTVKLVENQFVVNNWDNIEAIIRKVFTNSKFNDNRDVKRPLSYTWDSVTKSPRKGLKHVIAFDEENNILGALFGVATEKKEEEKEFGMGWFFTNHPVSEKRREIGDAIYITALDTLRKAGFERVVTNIGTKAGERFLSQRHGYVHKPIEGKENRWVRELNK